VTIPTPSQFQERKQYIIKTEGYDTIGGGLNGAHMKDVDSEVLASFDKYLPYAQPWWQNIEEDGTE